MIEMVEIRSFDCRLSMIADRAGPESELREAQYGNAAHPPD